jgi:hypothetical protein
MPSTMSLRGYVFNDAGAAQEGVEVKVFKKNTTATALVTATSDTAGLWNAAWDASGDTDATQVDVQGTSGTSVFRWKYDDRVALNRAFIEELHIIPERDFSFKFAGAPTQNRTITFSDNAGTVALLGAAQTFSAAQTFTNTVTVGVDDDGKDVKFYGETSGQYMLWDESADELVLAGDTKLSFHDAAGGENIIASANGHLEINSGTTLDVTAPTVDINASSAVTVDSAGISLDGSAASNFTTSGGALTLTSAAAATWSTAAGALTVNGTAGINLQEGGSTIISISDARVLATSNTASVDLDATGAIQVNSSGGAISIANDNVDQTVNLATAGTRTLNIGIGDGTDITTTVMKGTVSVGVDDAGYDVTFFGDTASRYWLWDTSADGVVQRGTLTVGVDDAGHDVKFFGDTAGAYILWDTSADKLLTAGGAVIDIVKDKLLIGGTAVTTTAAELNLLDTASAGSVVNSKAVIYGSSGELAGTTLAVSGNADIDGIANLDVVDIDGAVQLDATFSVGVDDQGYDVKFFGDTASAYMLWDTSADDLILGGAAGLVLGSGGIVFPGTQSEISDGNTLDDYEEATFTPQLSDGTSTLTTSGDYNIQIGQYTKIGNRVFFNIGIRNTTDLSGLTGTAQLRVVGLPFTAAATIGRSAVAIGAGSALNLDAANQTPTGSVVETTNAILFGVWDATSGLTDMKVSELSQNGFLNISGHYQIAT